MHDLTALRYPQMCTPDVLESPGLLRRALRRGAWVHTVSGYVADEVREAFPEAGDRVVAVPNGLRPPPDPDAASDHAAGHHLAGGPRYVLALGTVDPRKDLPTLVHAFDTLATRDDDLRLVIAGADGLGTAHLDAAIVASPFARRIVRLGRVDERQRVGLLRGATVVAYPSVYEGFGLVPLEAMAVGTPVVATRVGAVPEVVGDAALLVAAHDTDALAVSLGQVLADGALAASLAAEGRERVDPLHVGGHRRRPGRAVPDGRSRPPVGRRVRRRRRRRSRRSPRRCWRRGSSARPWAPGRSVPRWRPGLHDLEPVLLVAAVVDRRRRCGSSP